MFTLGHHQINIFSVTISACERCTFDKFIPTALPLKWLPEDLAFCKPSANRIRASSQNFKSSVYIFFKLPRTFSKLAQPRNSRCGLSLSFYASICKGNAELLKTFKMLLSEDFKAMDVSFFSAVKKWRPCYAQGCLFYKQGE